MTLESAKDYVTLHQLAKAAKINLDKNLWDYLTGGSETETTLRRNRLAIDSFAFRPRVLRNVSAVDPSYRFLGREMTLPVMLAPMGSCQAFHEGGGATQALAAGTFGVPYMVSSACLPGLEETAAAGSGPGIFQLYVRGDDEFVDDHVRRAIDAGYVAFCFTVDTAVLSRRERDLAKRYLPASRRRARGPQMPAAMRFQAGLSWDHVKRYKDKFDLPLVLKGIATVEDAEIACGHGVDVVYVSNHGGRQLDHGLGSIAVLPEIVAAVDGRAEVIVDGSFLRGTDILKAVALGARSVGLGRLIGFAMAAAGPEGVLRALEILEQEIRVDMALLGVTKLDELGPEFLSPAQPVTEPHVMSAFPLLNLDDEGY